MPDGLSRTQVNPSSSSDGLLVQSLKEMPEAAKELAVEAWHHPLDTAVHVGKTLVESAAAGALLGAIIPSRGPAAVLTGLAFMAPVAIGEYKRYKDAQEQIQAGGNRDEIVHNFARGSVSDLGNLGLSFIGGGLGTEAGHWLAQSDTSVGAGAQSLQRMIINGENKAMLTASSLRLTPFARPAADIATARMEPAPGFVPGADGVAPTAAGNAKPFFVREGSPLHTRLQQVQAKAEPWVEKDMTFHGHYFRDDGVGTEAQIFQSAHEAGLQGYTITPHNHELARNGVDDAVRTEAEKGVTIYAKDPKAHATLVAEAKKATVEDEFVAMPGNELGTIGKATSGSSGIENPRGTSTPPQEGPLEPSGTADVPMETLRPQAEPHFHLDGEERVLPEIPENPTVRRTVLEPDGTLNVHEQALPPDVVQLMKDNPALADTSVHSHDGDGFHLHGQESFVAAGARPEQAIPLKPDGTIDWAKTHHGGGNHIGSIGNEFPIIADVQGRPRTPVQGLVNFGRRMFGMRPLGRGFTDAEGAVHYDDGDWKTLISQLRDKDVWLVFNHPRDNLQGDYGIRSFKSRTEWAKAMGEKVRGIEIVKGEALNPNPVSVMKPQDMAPAYMSAYNSFGAVKEPGQGIYASPFYGRDDHFAIPGARPAATGVFIRNGEHFNQASVMDAIANRRTMVTTNYRLLRGYMTANDDAYMMGSILDQAATPQLNLRMRIGGDIDPKAQYTVNLWGDTNLLDSKLAQKVDSQTLTGQQLLDAGSQVSFGPQTHKLGTKANWYIEVQRTDPKTANVDYLWTAPIWMENLAGNSHAFWTRAFVGAGAQQLFR
jgi:hypothetical protein